MRAAFITVLGAALIALGASGLAWGEHDDDDDRGGRASAQGSRTRGDLASVTNEGYRTECGGCHFAYQPGLLPAAAWGRIMNTLDQHFGDDASLDPALKDELLAYLDANAADRSGGKRAGSFAAGKITGDGLPRITQTTYFKRKHHEVPIRYVKDNAQVKSFSACAACHPGADKGNFNEHQVKIPGVGRFED
ncbi:diheme cytochrome c [uncultured Thiodictyon sp.]|jgi:hypothetical protein|uniref:diheme cytochrome c n=1 Tax=uncultured Thiodictyon sp. TaxID=1846217 RepID=UPI0025F6AC2A|nr:diheme cytochrome c [uncultured Thiodictyon sp.]